LVSGVKLYHTNTAESARIHEILLKESQKLVNRIPVRSGGHVVLSVQVVTTIMIG
jgi:capsule polysaccharide export protein KpsE/RkpR